MERLDCHVKEYAWGKRGEESEVARLFSAGHSQFQIGKSTPYAELWMGTHPDGPARVRGSSDCLSRLIAKMHLPYIMKIMSIKHTLSLQVHPTKEQAAILHKKDPINYPDMNHKPELAYALTRFELLCGFRPATQIVENMRAFPELRKVMGEKNCEKFEQLTESGAAETKLKAAIRECFKKMLNEQVENPEVVEEQLKSLYRRIDANVRGCLIEDTIRIMKDTFERFPKDVGCFAPLYLNHMILEPGQCCFYEAEELHAYLRGECVECVGCSNNTIRAALTPKFIDRENLVNVLNYRMTDPEFYMVPACPLPDYPHVVEYAPDCKDFTLHQIEIPSESAESESRSFPVELPALECASIIVMVEGEAECEQEYVRLDSENSNCPLKIRKTHNSSSSVPNVSNGSDSANPLSMKRGDIYYIPPGRVVRFTAVSSEERILAYRTFSYEVGPDHSQRLTAAPQMNSSTKNGVKSTMKTAGINGALSQVKPKCRPPSTHAPTYNGNVNTYHINSVIPLKISQKALGTTHNTRPKLFGIERDDQEKQIMFDVESEMDGFC
ncbi:phosphomannose isomerase type I domain-containing protein [Ditylenchus destructor]|uniref:mannose-6-phosphate isomerase n=1 Tax=Ditylenchus destructor TaxID=166010 RepID=A0AAD4NAI8_9BILA|nr:phosphomannose isomerase type I domain-containing protein [Ditylenchus destructor]